MLSPDFILHLSEKAEAISEQLHNAIVRRIVARFLAQMQRYGEIKVGATSRWQMQVLREAGYLYEDIQKEIAAKTKLEYDAIKEAFETAGLRSYNYDSKIFRDAGISTEPLSKSPYYMRMLESHYRRTNDEWRNYTRTTADQAQVDFINACDSAFHQVSSGAISYSEAVADAVEQIGSNGVEVKYPSGHKDTLETATLRAVRTGTAQACAAITDARMDENDWDIILVSAHLGARVTKNEDFTNHAWWQGKFYSKSGRDPRFPPFSVCGKGDVQGITGANCRHSYGPGDGVFNPYEHFDSEENKKAYELSQRQRAMERRIRKAKRELMALRQGVEDAKDPDTAQEIKDRYDRKKKRLLAMDQEYRDFCKDNGLKPLYDRINISGYTTKNPIMTLQEDVMEEYEKEATPGVGSITFEDGYKISHHSDEINGAQWLHDTYGGDIILKRETNDFKQKSADYLWRDKLWDYKMPTTVKAADDRMRHGMKQIQDNPGGIILDYKDNMFNMSDLRNILYARAKRSNLKTFDVIVISKHKALAIYRYKKIEKR